MSPLPSLSSDAHAAPGRASIPAALRDRLAPICVAITADNHVPLFEHARVALGESRLIEMRFDALTSPADAPAQAAREAVELLHFFCADTPGATVLATCRRKAGGGGFLGSIEEQLDLLTAFADAGAALVDVELETLEAASPDQLAKFGAKLEAAGVPLLVSAHDFKTTGDLESTLARLRTLGAPARPSIYKVVSTAERLTDNVRMLRFVAATSREVPIVGMCMGEAGLVSRALSFAAGSLFTFASSTGGGPTAPGQVSAALLLKEYRAASVTLDFVSKTGGTALYGVAGNPVTHSLSPALHNAAFREARIDAVYLPLHTTSVDDLLAMSADLGFSGLSVTMPWKVELLPKLDAIDALSAKIGAVNTVARLPDGSLFGTNTDAPAIVEPLRKRLAELGLRLAGARVLLLGAGGAARAAAFALAAEGAVVSILNRSTASAEQLAAESGARVAVDPGAPGIPGAENAGHYDVVVNATPAGMLGNAQQELILSPDALEGVRVAFEMVYRPAETPLTKLCRSLGIEVIHGLEMFVQQGVRQWELWTGREAPKAVMQHALETALRQQG